MRGRYSPLLPWALLVITVVTGCVDKEATNHRFEVVEQNGVSTAITTGGPRYSDNLFDFQPILTLHENPLREESMLFRPNAILSGEDGKYYVCDTGNGRIAVFSPGGEFEYSFGRKGEGPGEFRMMSLQSLQEGIVSVFDYTMQRTTHFRTDGAIEDIFSSPIGGYALSLERTPEGTILQSGVRMELDGTVGSTQLLITIAPVTSRDTSTVISTGMVRSDYRQVRQMPNGSSISFGKSLPFAGGPEITYVPGRGILATDGEFPELTWYDTTGRKTQIILIDLPVVPVTTEMKQDYLTRERAQEELSGREPLNLEYDWPEVVGFWRRIIVDDAGYIWCLDVLDLDQHIQGKPYCFHVIDPEGRYLGMADLPTSLPRITNGKLTCFTEDHESGESVPSIFTIRSAVEGFIYP